MKITAGLIVCAALFAGSAAHADKLQALGGGAAALPAA